MGDSSIHFWLTEQIAQAEGKRLRFQHTPALNLGHWEAAGASPELMCSILEAWMRGFLQGVNPEIEAEVESRA